MRVALVALLTLYSPTTHAGPDFGGDPPRSYMSDARLLWNILIGDLP